MTKNGFTFIELLLAIVFLSLALLSLLMMNSYSNRGSLDSYFEMLAFSLAKEPIEVFRGFGYSWLKNYAQHPLAKYPADNGWNPILDSPTEPAQHPFEAGSFERRIMVTTADFDGVNALRVTVGVRPMKKSRVDSWLMKDEVVLNALIVEGPK